jgi:hypothetical protein
MLSVRGLGGESVELFGRSAALIPVLAHHLSFLDHGHECNTDQGRLRCLKGLASEHGPDDPLDSSMILFDPIVKIFHLADDDRRPVLRLVALDRGFMRVAAVNGDRLGGPLRPIAFVKNRSAASVSRCFVSRKSMVWPSLSTAPYR